VRDRLLPSTLHMSVRERCAHYYLLVLFWCNRSRETKRKMYSLERGSEPEVQRPVSGADGVEEDDDGSDRASENDGQIRRDHRVLTAKGFRQDDTAPGRTVS